MKVEEIYLEFLNQSYLRIVKACLQDQAIETLKVFEDKSYLIDRIKQIFSEVYIQEREQKIISLSTTKVEYERIIKKLEQASCSQCTALENKIFSKEQSQSKIINRIDNSCEQKMNKRIYQLLSEENQAMKIKIDDLQRQILIKQRLIEKQITENKKQGQSIHNFYQNETKKLSQTVQCLNEELKKLSDQNTKMQSKLFVELENKIKLEKKIKDLTIKSDNLELMNDQIKFQVSLTEQELEITKQKLNRLSSENQYLLNKIEQYEKDLNNYKSGQNDRERNQKVYSFRQRQSQYQIEPLIDTVLKQSNLEKKSIQLQNLNIKLNNEIDLVRRQKDEIIFQKQKIILKMAQDSKKDKIIFQKQLKEEKERLKKSLNLVKSQKENEIEAIKEQINRRNNYLIEEKNKSISKHESEIIILSKRLQDCQMLLKQQIQRHRQEVMSHNQKLKEEIQKQKFYKKFINQEKTNESEIQNFYKIKMNQKQEQLKQIKNDLEAKEKELLQFKREINNQTQKTEGLSLKLGEQVSKNEIQKQIYEDYRNQIFSLKNLLKEKQFESNNLDKRITKLKAEKQQLETKILIMIKNQKKISQKNSHLQEQLKKNHENMANLKQKFQSEIIEVHEKSQKNIDNARKQTESFYLNLLKEAELKVKNSDFMQKSAEKNSLIQTLKQQIISFEQNYSQSKAKYIEQLQTTASLRCKIEILEKELEETKNENKKLNVTLDEAKSEQIILIKNHQAKMRAYSDYFLQFKREFYLGIRIQLDTLQKQMKQIIKYIQNERQNISLIIVQTGKKIYSQIQQLRIHNKIRVQKVRHQYDYGICLQLEEEKKDLIMQAQVRLKQKTVQFLTVLAQKQHQLNLTQQRLDKADKITQENQYKITQAERLTKDYRKKNQQFKIIITKMQVQVCESEKQKKHLSQELQYYKLQNVQLHKQLGLIQHSFKEKIQKCRQKYIQQNQRIFNRYQKQFSKLFVANKRSAQVNILNSSLSANNLLIPTKEDKDNKLDKMHREIEEQKKKLKQLEGLHCKPTKGQKFNKTVKLTSEKDQPKIKK